MERLLRRRIARVFTKYTAGSAMAAVVSEAVLMGILGFDISGPKVASISAWFAGAVVNFTVSRRWTWRTKGRRSTWRELLPFWATSVAALIAATWTSTVAHGFAPEITRSHPLQVAFVGAVYLGTYGVLFIGKFLLFHFVIFGRRPASAVSSR